MIRRRVFPAVFVSVVVALLAAGYVYLAGGNAYQLKLVFPNAANVGSGSPIQIDGFDAGEITELQANDGKAVVTVEIDDAKAPLHAGTRALVEWRAALGERIIRVVPGPRTNPELANGEMIQAKSTQVEVDQVLAALDKPTRQRLNGLIEQLNGTLRGREGDVRDTVRSAGPAVRALGQVLDAVGRDGPAIRGLVTRLREMSGPLAQRQGELREVVDDLTRFTGPLAQQQEQLKHALRGLPATLDTAKKTLDMVPAASDAAQPLLNDLRPATAKLPSVSKNLSPMLTDLRPTVAQLRPALMSAQTLLRHTPELLDSSHAVLPDVTKALTNLTPAISFLRPYTPEAVGWAANWGSSFANYDTHGHYFHGLTQAGPTALNDNPGIRPPFTRQVEKPAPGANEGQPWTDANGSGMR